MTELVDRSRQPGAQVIVQTPALATAGAVRRVAGLRAYAEAVRKLAAGTDAVLVDHERQWAQRFGELGPIEWLDDHSHPNAVRHLQMANLCSRRSGSARCTSDPEPMVI